MKTNLPQISEELAATFNHYALPYRSTLLELRKLIYTVAGDRKVIENLKWRQPSYKTIDGTPIRIDVFAENQVALFVNCQTTLIEQYKMLFGDTLTFSNNRAIIFDIDKKLPIQQLKICIDLTMKYHLKR